MTFTKYCTPVYLLSRGCNLIISYKILIKIFFYRYRRDKYSDVLIFSKSKNYLFWHFTLQTLSKSCYKRETELRVFHMETNILHCLQLTHFKNMTLSLKLWIITGKINCFIEFINCGFINIPLIPIFVYFQVNKKGFSATCIY